MWIALFTHTPLPPAEEEKPGVDAVNTGELWALHLQQELATASTSTALGSPVLLPRPAELCSRVGALLWALKSATLPLVWGVPSPQSHSVPPRHSCWPHGDSSQLFKVKLSFRQTSVPGLSKEGDKTSISLKLPPEGPSFRCQQSFSQSSAEFRVPEGFSCPGVRRVACVWPLDLSVHKEENCDTKHGAPSTLLP